MSIILGFWASGLASLLILMLIVVSFYEPMWQELSWHVSKGVTQ